MRLPAFVLASFVLAAFVLAACGGTEPVDPEPDAGVPADAAPRQTVMESRTLLVGDIAEGILDGGAGDVAVISVMAPVARLDWNIHGHAGNGTQTITEGFDVMSVAYTFAPTAQADWYLLLRNRDTAPMTIDVRIELYGDMQWSGWE